MVSSDIVPRFKRNVPMLTTLAESSFKSSLQFEDAEEFQSHLTARSEDIRAIISQVQAKASDAPAELSEVQNRLAKKLSEEKVIIAKLEKALAEKQQVEDCLEAAASRYMRAEQKLDRAKSVTVAKLEKQQLMGSQQSGESAPSKQEESTPANGSTPVSDRNPELEESHAKLKAISEKQREQVEKLEAENASLLSQITENKVKVPSTPVVSHPYCGSL